MRFCTKCGNPLPYGNSDYCPNCGGTAQPGYDGYPPVTESAAPARRRLEPQHILLIVLTALIVALGTIVIILTNEKPVDTGTVTYVDEPVAEGGDNDAATTTAPARTTTAPVSTPQPSATPGVSTPAATGGVTQFCGFSYHVPSGFTEVSSGASDVRTYHNESLNMTIVVTVLDTADPYGVLARNKAALDGDPSLNTTYSDGRDNWFVRSGYDGNGWVFYSKNKVYTERANTFASIDFSYPASANKSTCDDILTNFVNDFGLS